jgi:hypothetical protein
LAIGHTPQRIDQVVVRQLVLLLLLILDCDAVLAGIKAGNASLKKLDLRVAQDLRKRATKDVLVGGKLMESGTHGEGVRFIDQRDLDGLVGHFAGQAQGKEQARNPRAKN